MSRTVKWGPGKRKITNHLARQVRRDRHANQMSRKDLSTKYDLSMSTVWWLYHPDIVVVDEQVRAFISEFGRQIEHMRLSAKSLAKQTRDLELAEDVQREIRHLELSADTLEAQAEQLMRVFDLSQAPDNVTPFRREA